VLSTDKAVYPINAMGMSKALMEKVMLAKARQIDNNSTILCATRYGNVIGSRGSVIPLFIQQIKQSQPITVTDPNMTRFMMTLDQAIDLVIYAFENCSQGDIFVQKAPAATIGTLAQALIEIFEVNLEIKIIGPRHGEKVFETLLSREEAYRAIDLGNYFRVPLDYRDLNYSKYLDMGSLEMSKAKEYTSETTKLLSKEELKSLLLSIDFVQNELKGFLKDKRYI
jgi:UDP-glucose 4-epimerase